MPAPANLLPVYSADDSFRGYISIPTAQRMLAEGHVVGRGTTRSIRALIVVHDNVDLIVGERMPAGQRYSHNRETRDNPKGVWTFKRLHPPT